MNEIASRATMSPKDLYETFNMGVGMVITVKNLELAKSFLEKNGETILVMGKTTKEFVQDINALYGIQLISK